MAPHLDFQFITALTDYCENIPYSYVKCERVWEQQMLCWNRAYINNITQGPHVIPYKIGHVHSKLLTITQITQTSYENISPVHPGISTVRVFFSFFAKCLSSCACFPVKNLNGCVEYLMLILIAFSANNSQRSSATWRPIWRSSELKMENKILKDQVMNGMHNHVQRGMFQPHPMTIVGIRSINSSETWFFLC